jgi:hypothetical protein
VGDRSDPASEAAIVVESGKGDARRLLVADEDGPVVLAVHLAHTEQHAVEGCQRACLRRVDHRLCDPVDHVETISVAWV